MMFVITVMNVKIVLVVNVILAWQQNLEDNGSDENNDDTASNKILWP